MPARVKFMGGPAAGAGDGSSYANRAAWSWTTYRGWLAAERAAWDAGQRTVAADTDVHFTSTYTDLAGVLQTTTGWPVVTGGTRNGQPVSASNPAVPGVYIDDQLVAHYEWVPARIAFRVRLCGPGQEVLGNAGSSQTFPPSEFGPGGAGTDASPIIVFYTESDDPANPGQPIPDTPAVTETVSTTVAHKAGTAAQQKDPANHDGTVGWVDKTNIVDKVISWPVERPRTGFTFAGARAPDPRTEAQKSTQIRITYRTDQMVYNPANTTTTNPIFKKTDGTDQPYIVNRGERFDMPTKTVIAATDDTGGNAWAKTPPGYHGFRGIQWKNFSSPFDYAIGTSGRTWDVRFVGFRSCKSDNTRYWNARGPRVSDVWAYRMENLAWSAKCHTPETSCERWLFQHIWQRGQFVCGDYIKAGFQSSEPWDAGPLILENMFGDCYWDSSNPERDAAGKVINHGGTGSTRTEYPQGEGVDWEGNNLVMRRVKIDLALDGCIDTKPRTKWIGYSRVFLDNIIFSRSRRTMRLWYPGGSYDGAQNRSNPAVLRNLTVVDCRDRALHVPTAPSFHNVITWRNDDGRAMCDKNRQYPSTRTYNFRLTEADDGSNAKGNSTVVAYQPLDLRPSASPALRYRGEDEVTLPVAPLATGERFRQLTRVTTTAAPTSPTYRQLLVDGVPISPDGGSGIGGSVKLTSPAAAAWRVYGPGSLTVAADTRTANFTPGGI